MLAKITSYEAPHYAIFSSYFGRNVPQSFLCPDTVSVFLLTVDAKFGTHTKPREEYSSEYFNFCLFKLTYTQIVRNRIHLDRH
jgi:hypothetical protein